MRRALCFMSVVLVTHSKNTPSHQRLHGPFRKLPVADREEEGILFVDHAGETLYRLEQA
jgi:hypothetical protein